VIFDANYLRGRLQQRPFRPFALLTTNGDQYAVRHPDQAFLTLQYVEVSTAAAGTIPSSEQVTHIALAHLVEVRDLPLTVPATGNGQAES
jgi:hypothetical protein